MQLQLDPCETSTESNAGNPPLELLQHRYIHVLWVASGDNQEDLIDTAVASTCT